LNTFIFGAYTAAMTRFVHDSQRSQHRNPEPEHTELKIKSNSTLLTPMFSFVFLIISHLWPPLQIEALQAGDVVDIEPL